MVSVYCYGRYMSIPTATYHNRFDEQRWMAAGLWVCSALLYRLCPSSRSAFARVLDVVVPLKLTL